MAPTKRICADPRCGKPLDVGLPGQQKYCDAKCRTRKLDRDAYARKRAVELGVVPGRRTQADSADGRATARRGPSYEEFCSSGWPAKIALSDRGAVGGLTQSQVIELSGKSQANVARWYAAWLEDSMVDRARELWSRAPEIEALLEPTSAAFSAFRARYFTDEKGNPYLTPEPHERWIDALLWAVQNGGRQLILSPPRHGKTDLLTHFVVWLICQNPNIRILWVGGNEGIATNAVGAVIDHLANNEQMADELLGPGGSWRPAAKSGKSWTSKKMSVATRTVTGLKSATLTALGKGGTMLSLDADVIVGDDIVDFASTLSVVSRKNDLDWFTQDLGSRKMEHTAQIGIGSRVHHGDLWGSLLGNVAWRAIVEHAHDPECELPTHGPVSVDEHAECEICAAHVDCMLFPEIRSMRWLQDTRSAAADDVRWEMIYQNITHAEGAEWVTAEDLRRSRNPGRIVGQLPTFPADDGLVHDVRLVAGTDPAAKGFQASFLWAFDVATGVRYMLDMDNRRAGGLEGARLIMREWHERYGVRTWVVERNGYQEAVLQDRDIVEFAAQNGIALIPHYTDRHNKMHPDFGVPAQFVLFRRGLIDLPAGDAQSIDKIRVYEQQILNFEPESSRASHHQPSDVVMAAWFPETQFRNWVGEMVRMVSTGNVGYAQHTLGGVVGSKSRPLSGMSRSTELSVPVGAG